MDIAAKEETVTTDCAPSAPICINPLAVAVAIFFPEVAFVIGMSQASNEDEIVVPMLLWGATGGDGGARGAADDTVTGYRAVSRAEADDIAQHGFRPGAGSMDAKWFSESREGAEFFLKAFSDLSKIVEAKIPGAVYRRSFKHRNIDGTGPGVCVACEDLPLVVPVK